jgi:hypothetical protein
VVTPAVGLLALAFQTYTAALPPPELRLEAPPDLAAARARLESVDPERLRAIAPLVGLDRPGAPIRVVLAPEGSDWARSMPPWVAGFALVDDGVIVLFPNRSPVYPHDTIEDVLRHEVAHVLIGRAAAGHAVPRWFHEGLALAAERPWGLRDRTRLIAELALGPRHTLASLDALFQGEVTEQTRAYAVSGALVRDLLARHGRLLPSTVLARVADGVPFDVAFEQVTGRSLLAAEAAFWRDQRVWTTWLPLVTSTTTLWLIVAVLAVYAMRRLRAQRAARRAQWPEAEDLAPDEPRLDEPGEPRGS